MGRIAREVLRAGVREYLKGVLGEVALEHPRAKEEIDRMVEELSHQENIVSNIEGLVKSREERLAELLRHEILHIPA